MIVKSFTYKPWKSTTIYKMVVPFGETLRTTRTQEWWPVGLPAVAEISRKLTKWRVDGSNDFPFHFWGLTVPSWFSGEFFIQLSWKSLITCNHLFWPRSAWFPVKKKHGCFSCWNFYHPNYHRCHSHSLDVDLAYHLRHRDTQRGQELLKQSEGDFNRSDPTRDPYIILITSTLKNMQYIM